MIPARPSPAATVRFDLAPDEDRALLVSYLVATLLAAAWLTLVHVLPGPTLATAAEPPTIIFEPAPDSPTPTPTESRAVRAGEGSRPGSSSGGAGSVRDLFKGNPGLVDAGILLRGVDPSVGDAPSGERVGKVGLGTGVRSRTPGMTRPGGLGTGADAGVGTVRGRGVSRQAVTIAAPEVRAVTAGAASGDAIAVGQTARAHTPQLERCYHQEGLTRNASLAGLVRLAIDVEAGRVTTARIVDRSWTGAGVAETESCLVRAVRGWRLGSANAHIVLPLSFTSPLRGSR